MVPASAVQTSVVDDVLRERAHQDHKWGGIETRHISDETWVTVLLEEAGEVAKALLEGKDADLYAELMDVAAVAVAHAERLRIEGRHAR